jgi:hypothetical protein
MRNNSSGNPNENLDSLVDIVSNSVGILVILAVFTALLSITEAPPEAPESAAPEEELLSIEKKRLPWSPPSQKSSLLFVLQDNRLLYLDRIAVYQSLQEEIDPSADVSSIEVQLPEFRAELSPQSTQNHCLQFFPEQGAGQWWGEVSGSSGKLPQLLAQHSPSETYLFFWVDGASFELLRDIRDWAWDQNFDVGWKPINPQSSLRYCTGLNRSLSFRPQ